MKYRVEDHIIDTDLFRISRAGRDIAVEPKVFDLLVYLISHRERVIPREELFREVWDGREVTDTTLSNHVKSARKLLGDNGDLQRVIQTVRGRGYQFIARVSEAGSGDGASPETDAPLASNAGPGPEGGLRWEVLAFALAMVSAMVIILVSNRDGNNDEALTAEDSQAPYILVVPFDVSGENRDTWEPFADQVTREVIRNLRKISGLRVVPPPSSFTFKNNKARDFIRGQLPDVHYVLDGVVSVGAGNAIRITPELESLATDSLVWDSDYLSNIDDTNFFTVQSDIASAVSAALEVVILEEEQLALGELPTTDLVAYESYVAGRRAMERFTHESLPEAISLFDAAIAQDPEFTAAYVARADANRMLMSYFEPPINMLPEVIDSVSAALSLDPDSAEALSSLGLGYLMAWRWEDAWTILNEARDRDPDLALTELGFALYYAGLGDAAGVKRSLAAANRLDPLNIELADWGQWALSMVGEVDAALDWVEEKMAQHPEVGMVYTGASVSASLAGDHDRAIALAEKGAALDPGTPIALITLAQVYGHAGQTEKVRPLLNEVARIGSYMCPYETAVAHLTLGQTDRVFELLDDAVSYRSNCLIFLRHDPRMQPLRSDPRYARLLARVGLDDAAVNGYKR